jgi:hypothetical protein
MSEEKKRKRKPRTVAKTRIQGIPKNTIALVPTSLLEENYKSTGRRIQLDKKRIELARDMCKWGCKDKDIYSALKISEKTYFNYIKDARYIEAYDEVHRNRHEEEGIKKIYELPDTITVIESDGYERKIYHCNLKLQFLQEMRAGRAEGNAEDLQFINSKKGEDWKAAAWTLERRSPEYKNGGVRKEQDNEEGTKDDSKSLTLVQNIFNLAQRIEKEDKALLEDKKNKPIDVEYTKDEKK